MVNIKKKIEKICKITKSASYQLSNSSNKERNYALNLIAENITKFPFGPEHNIIKG